MPRASSTGCSGSASSSLVLRLETSLLITAVLGGLSILIAVLTHRHIVKPLERFESVARTIREMKIYSLRVDEDSSDEIGRLAASFNEMLAELAGAREREITEQSELARVTRSTAMGAMTASIAHEINQPLAAIVTNSNAALRWLGNATPNVEEARAALKRISADGHRASEVISRHPRDVQARRQPPGADRHQRADPRSPAACQHHAASAEDRGRDRPPGGPRRGPRRPRPVAAGVSQPDNQRCRVHGLGHRPRPASPGAVRSSTTMAACWSRWRILGTGIAQSDLNRVFEAFFTTKTSGMGMGLFICRSIIESHGGRLWAAPRFPHGTVFYVALPGETAGEE